MVVVEIVVGGGIVATELSRPQFPIHVEKLLDPYTSESLHHLRMSLSVDKADDWYMLGEAYLAYGSYLQAEACFRRAAELDPESVEIIANWGLALARLGRNTESNERFRSIAENAPALFRPEIWYRIGKNLLREEKSDEAEAAFRRVPEFPSAAYQLAKILMRSDRAEEAKLIIDDLLKAGANVMEINQIAAQCAEILGDKQASRKYYELTNRAPDRIALNRTVSLFTERRRRYGSERLLVETTELEKSGRIAESIQRFAKAMQDELGESAVAKIAELEVQLGHPQKAVKWIEAQIDRSGASALILERLGDAYLVMGQQDRTQQAWERGVRVGVRQELHEKLAQSYELGGNADRAQTQRGLVLHIKGLSNYRKNNLSEAFTDFFAAAQLLPNRSRTWFYLGQIHRFQGRCAQAKEAYRRCLSIEPGHGRADAALKLLENQN